MLTRSKALAARTSDLPLGPDEVQSILFWLGASDLCQAAATSKVWRECASSHFVTSEWQARSCALTALLTRHEVLPEAVRLHLKGRPEPVLHELCRLMTTLLTLHSNVQKAGFGDPFHDIFGRGPTFLVLSLGRKLALVFDFAIPCIRRAVQQGSLYSEAGNVYEENALFNLKALGEMLNKELLFEECIVVMSEQLDRITARWQMNPNQPYLEESVYHSMNVLANALDSNVEVKEAIALHRIAMKGRRNLLGARHLDTCASMANLGMALQRDWQWAEAETLFAEELALTRLNGDDKDTLVSITLLAEVLQEQAEACPDGRESAEAKAREALSLYREAGLMAAMVHRDVWPTLKMRLDEISILRTLYGTGANEERVVRRVVLSLRQSWDIDPVQGFDPLTHGLWELGSVLHELGKFEKEELILTELSVLLRLRPDWSNIDHECYTRLDQSLVALGESMMEVAQGLHGAAKDAKLQEAVCLFKEAQEFRAAEGDMADMAVYIVRQAEAHLELGDTEEASDAMVEVWQCWKAYVMSTLPPEAFRYNPDTLRLYMCDTLVEHALLVVDDKADASRAEHVLQKLEQQNHQLQTIYPAGEKHWTAQWASAALQRARGRAAAGVPAAAKACNAPFFKDDSPTPPMVYIETGPGSCSYRVPYLGRR